MQELMISTVLGKIALRIDEQGGDEPLIFLHGVFLDRSLWAAYDTHLTGRTHVYVDMPAHGRSEDVGRRWTLDECAVMLIQILDALDLARCVVVGHSWGSMTALRAASEHPDRFRALCLCNMPFKRSSGIGRLGFQIAGDLL